MSRTSWLTLLLLLTTSGSLTGSVKLILETGDDYLDLYLMNTGSESVLVDKRFAVGPTPGGSNEVYFLFHAGDGKIFINQCTVRISLTTEEDYCWLGKGEFAGRRIPIKEVLRCFAMPPGEYRVEAGYQGHYLEGINGFSERLKSGKVPITIKKRHLSKLTRRLRRQSKEP